MGAVSSEQYYALFAEASEGLFTVDDARLVTQASLIAEYQGTSRVFDELVRAGVETAVLSNVNDAEWERLFPAKGLQLEFPVLQRVTHRFASHILGVRKPDPRAFFAVERATGHSGDQVLFLDDRAENVSAARTLGWTAEEIDHLGDTAAQIMSQLRRHAIIA